MYFIFFRHNALLAAAALSRVAAAAADPAAATILAILLAARQYVSAYIPSRPARPAGAADKSLELFPHKFDLRETYIPHVTRAASPTV